MCIEELDDGEIVGVVLFEAARTGRLTPRPGTCTPAEARWEILARASGEGLLEYPVSTRVTTGRKTLESRRKAHAFWHSYKRTAAASVRKPE